MITITGAAMTPFGRFDDASAIDLGVRAVRAALVEAGSPRFDVAYCATAYSGIASGHRANTDGPPPA